MIEIVGNSMPWIGLILGYGLLTHGIILFNDGLYWDGWLVDLWQQSKDRKPMLCCKRSTSQQSQYRPSLKRMIPWVKSPYPRNHSFQRWPVLGRLAGGPLAAEQGQEVHAPILLGSRHAEPLLRAPDAGACSTPSSGLPGDFPGLAFEYRGPRVPDCRVYEGLQPAAAPG